MSSGLDLHPRHVRRRTPNSPSCAGWWPRYGGYYCPHHRSYGAGALEAYEEMVALTREAGCAAPPGPRHHELRRERGPGARAAGPARRGARRRAPTSPWTPTPTRPAAPRSRRCCRAGRARAAPRRSSRGSRTRRRAERIRHAPGGRRAPTAATACPSSGTRSRSRASATRRWPATSAARSRESAGRRGEAPWTTARRLLLEDRLGTTILQHVGHEENVRAIMRHRGAHRRLATASSRAPSRTRAPTAPSRAISATYVRELGVLSLEECVAHLTGRPAARLRLPDRGLVREGYRADLVLFDPATVAAGLDLRGPAHPADGHPARPDRRPLRDRGRAAHGRPGGAGGPPHVRCDGA